MERFCRVNCGRETRVATQQPIPVVYEGTRFEIGFRADLVLEDKVIVEVKSVAEIAAVHKKQLLSYLRLGDKRLGLLINFNVVLIKDGIKRIVNRLEERLAFLASLRLCEKFRPVAHLQHIREAAL